jgi:hypothetical protein
MSLGSINWPGQPSVLPLMIAAMMTAMVGGSSFGSPSTGSGFDSPAIPIAGGSSFDSPAGIIRVGSRGPGVGSSAGVSVPGLPIDKIIPCLLEPLEELSQQSKKLSDRPGLLVLPHLSILGMLQGPLSILLVGLTVLGGIVQLHHAIHWRHVVITIKNAVRASYVFVRLGIPFLSHCDGSCKKKR